MAGNETSSSTAVLLQRLAEKIVVGKLSRVSKGLTIYMVNDSCVRMTLERLKTT